MPWSYSPRWLCGTNSIRALQASATRSSSTSMPKSSKTSRRLGNQSSRTAHAFQLERPASGVRREPGGHAARCRRTGCRSRRPYADDPAGSTPRPPPPRRRLPLPGVWRAFWAGSPHPSLGARWPHDALEPGAPMSATPPGGTRGGLPSRSRPGRRAAVPAAGWPADPRCPAAAPSTRGSREGLSCAARGAGTTGDVRSPKPGWFGERLDVGYAIDVLHPLARGH